MLSFTLLAVTQIWRVAVLAIKPLQSWLPLHPLWQPWQPRPILRLSPRDVLMHLSLRDNLTHLLLQDILIHLSRRDILMHLSPQDVLIHLSPRYVLSL